MRIHHIGIIVRNIQKALSTYLKLGYKQKSDIVIDDNQHIAVVFLLSEDNTQNIELIMALGPESTVYNFNESIHHICYEVDSNQDIQHWFKSLKIGKIFSNPIMASAIDNKYVVFAMLNTGTFVEFILPDNL